MQRLDYAEFRRFFASAQIRLRGTSQAKTAIGKLLQKLAPRDTDKEALLGAAYEAASIARPAAIRTAAENLSKGIAGEEHAWVFYYWLHWSENEPTGRKEIDRALLEGKTFEEVSRRAVVPWLQPRLHYPEIQTLGAEAESHAGAVSWLNPMVSDALSFFGRDEELAALDDFVRAGDTFLLWALSGPSGAGKSRLAVEWLRSLRERHPGWNVGFLTTELVTTWKEVDGQDWSRWTPRQGTVIVVDYLHLFSDDVRQIIRRFLNLKGGDATSARVRLLLIDHVVPNNLHDLWADPRFLGISARGALDADKDALIFRDRPLLLQAKEQPRAFLKEVMANAVSLFKGEAQDTEIEYALDELQSVEGAWAPLFAALRGRALALASSSRFSDRRELIRTYLDSDNRLPWRQTNPEKTAEGLWAGLFVAVSTATRGVSFEILADVLPPERQISRRRTTKLAQWIVSHSDPFNLAAYEPDILGETFFLTYWAETYNLDGGAKKGLIDALTAALTENDSAKFNDFVGFSGRAARNLANDNLEDCRAYWESLLHFLRPERFPAESGPRDIVSAALAGVAVALAVPTGRSDSHLSELIPLAIRCLDQLEVTAFERLFSRPECSFSAMLFITTFELASAVQHRHRAARGTLRLALTSFSAIFQVQAETTPLATASELGFIGAVRALLSDPDEDVNVRLMHGNTPLIIASNAGHAEVASELLARADIEVNQANDMGETALFIASFRGHANVVEKLLGRRGIAVNIRTLDGWTPLLTACERGHEAVVSRLFTHYYETDINQCSPDRVTPLYIACQQGHVGIVRTLLQHIELDPNFAADDATTPLMVAVQQCRRSIVKMLLAHERTDANAVDEKGWTALDWARQDRDIELEDMLVARGGRGGSRGKTRPQR